MLGFVKLKNITFFFQLVFITLFLTGCDTLHKQSSVTQSSKSQARPIIPEPVIQKPSLPQKRQGEQTLVALLLPFSGAGHEVGKSIMDAAKLALFDLKAQNIVLRPYDTGVDANQVIAQAENAIRDGAEVFLGPVFSQGTRAITALAQQANVPVLSLSNTPEIANHGVYPLGFNPGEQTKFLTEYLVDNGYKKIAILAPNTRYAQLAVESLKQGAHHATITREVYYDRSTTRFEEHIHALLGIAPGHTPNPKDFMDAIFIPERGDKLIQIVEVLAHQGVDFKKTKIFGPDILKEANASKEILLKGALFAAPDSVEREKFRKRFMNTYHYEPSEIATIAYDTIALITSFTKEGLKVSNQALTQKEGFNGIDGPFRFNEHGEVERRYAIFEIDQNTARIIVPPSRHF